LRWVIELISADQLRHLLALEVYRVGQSQIVSVSDDRKPVALLGEYQHRYTGQIQSLVDIVGQTIINVKAAYDPQQFSKPIQKKPAVSSSSVGELASAIPGRAAGASTLTEKASGAPVSEVGVFAGVVSGDVSHEKGAGASHTAAPPPVTLPGGIIRGETMDMRRGGAITERRYAESPAAPVHEPEPEQTTAEMTAVEPAPAAFADAFAEHHEGAQS
jgi:hypothetical protein